MSNQIDFFDAARDAAIEWARATLADPTAVILDTETTGLGPDDQIVQIAVLGIDGRELLNELVRPTCPIEPGAQALHGIGMEQLLDKPGFEEIFRKLAEVTNRRKVVIYNADYDVRIIRQSSNEKCVSDGPWEPEYTCAMIEYAQFCGDWNEYRGNFRWQRLPGGDHSAIGDCWATLDIIRKMAEAKLTSEKEASNV
jgi:DNA polymerase-3 subunit epsilon